MQWTPEQQPIIGSRANKLRILAIMERYVEARAPGALQQRA